MNHDGRARVDAGGAVDISRLDILRGATESDVLPHLGGCVRRDLAPGEVLLRRGEPNDTMYLLLAGRLRVHLEIDAEPVAFLESGVSVGEMSVIDGSPASAFVIADEAASLLAVTQATFWTLVKSSHAFAQNLLVLMASRVRATNSEAARAVQLKSEAEQASLTDALTGLQNRRWLEETAPRMAERLLRDGKPFSVAMLDLDHFKRLNDEHGHHTGDLALATVGEILRTRLRPFDAAARYGGEELVVLLPSTPLDGALVAAERLRQLVESARQATSGEPLPPMTVSVGVAELHPEETLMQGIARADAALYVAKRTGRNRVQAAL